MTMMMFEGHSRILQGLSFSMLVLFFSATESHAATCGSLQGLSLPDTTINLAQSGAAGDFSSPDAGRPGAPPTADFKQLPAFCRVTATLRPSTDSDIKTIQAIVPLFPGRQVQRHRKHRRGGTLHVPASVAKLSRQDFSLGTSLERQRLRVGRVSARARPRPRQRDSDRYRFNDRNSRVRVNIARHRET